MSNHVLTGKWIALDGVDAVGKSTQVKRLQQLIEADGQKCLVLNESSDSPVGSMIGRIIEEHRFYALHALKKTPYADTYALMADLAYKIESEADDVLRSGGTVVSDRGLLSLIGYQARRIEDHSTIAPKGAVTRATSIVKSAFESLRIPDLHILLTISEEEMQRRVIGRGETEMEGVDLAFMRDVNKIMMGLSSEFPTEIIDVTLLDQEATSILLMSKILNK